MGKFYDMVPRDGGGVNRVKIDWGTHITCSSCGEKIPRGIANWADHYFKCTYQFTEDADFEIVGPLQLLSSEQNPDECDATEGDSSTEAGNKNNTPSIK